MTINFNDMNQVQAFISALTSVMNDNYGFTNVKTLPMNMSDNGSLVFEWRIVNMKITDIIVTIDDGFWASVKIMEGKSVKFEFEQLGDLENFIHGTGNVWMKYGKIYGFEKLQYENMLQFFRAWC